MKSVGSFALIILSIICRSFSLLRTKSNHNNNKNNNSQPAQQALSTQVSRRRERERVRFDSRIYICEQHSAWKRTHERTGIKTTIWRGVCGRLSMPIADRVSECRAYICNQSVFGSWTHWRSITVCLLLSMFITSKIRADGCETNSTYVRTNEREWSDFLTKINPIEPIAIGIRKIE